MSDEYFRDPSSKFISEVKQAHPWLTDHRYFKTTKISAAAAMKMLQHAVEGVDKGLRRKGKSSTGENPNDKSDTTTGNSAGGYGAPIEIMGLMAGRPATAEDYFRLQRRKEGHVSTDHHLSSSTSLEEKTKMKTETDKDKSITPNADDVPPEFLQSVIVTDVFPLPVEGTETRVIADDANVINYMVQITEMLEKTRGEKERLIGWYHSHPFDVDVEPNYFLSSIDVSTQWLWQHSAEKIQKKTGEADIWIAVVVDPLRSIAKGQPEMGSFRCFPPNASVEKNICPDGKYEPDQSKRVKRWGASADRYYMMDIEYFMSELSRNLLQVLSKKYLWMKVLSNDQSKDMEYRQQLVERIGKLNRHLACGCRALDKPGIFGKRLQLISPDVNDPNKTEAFARYARNVVSVGGRNNTVQQQQRSGMTDSDYNGSSSSSGSYDNGGVDDVKGIPSGLEGAERSFDDASGIANDLSLEFRCNGAKQLFKSIIFDQ
eukprot:g2178.t1